MLTKSIDITELHCTVQKVHSLLSGGGAAVVWVSNQSRNVIFPLFGVFNFKKQQPVSCINLSIIMTSNVMHSNMLLWFQSLNQSMNILGTFLLFRDARKKTPDTQGNLRLGFCHR